MTAKETFTVTERWKRLSKTQKIEEVRTAMANGHSNKSAARALGTKPGIVAGIRFRERIPSTHEAYGSYAQRTKEDARVVPKDEVVMSQTTEEVIVVNGPKVQVAAPGHECNYTYRSGKQCFYLPMDPDPERPGLDLDRCKLHQRKK